MDFKIGIILFPLMILGMILKQKGPAALFVKLGAVSPETARRPPEMKLGQQYQLPDLVKRGVLVPAGDGRYWVDRAILRRRRWFWTIAMLILAALLLVAVYWLWPEPAPETWTNELMDPF